MNKTKLILLSGFLGSGKTTLMLSAAESLRAHHNKVVCITNDQGESLVDSKMVLRHEIPLQQIQGGCFCCRFDQLTDSIHQIMEEEKPDIIIAEAVGSCTDLVATVIKPIKAFYGELIEVKPLTTVIDPGRLEEKFLQKGRSFTNEISYLFDKQIEEANYLILNKTDLLTKDQIIQLTSTLNNYFPTHEVFSISALNQDNVGEWLKRVNSIEETEDRSIDIDYDIYAEGEAQLGWLNGNLILIGRQMNITKITCVLMERLLMRFCKIQSEIAHLKIWVEDSNNNIKLSAVNNHDSFHIENTRVNSWYTNEVIMWLNARINIDANALREIVEKSLYEIREEFGINIQINQIDCFSPSRPIPTFRMA